MVSVEAGEREPDEGGDEGVREDHLRAGRRQQAGEDQARGKSVGSVPWHDGYRIIPSYYLMFSYNKMDCLFFSDVSSVLHLMTVMSTVSNKDSVASQILSVIHIGCGCVTGVKDGSGSREGVC
jgi:hypothetical protein